MKATHLMAVAVMVCGFGLPTQAEVSIETATVGNPGNPGEWSGMSYGGHGTSRLCGAVDYTFAMGKFEVTAGQYTEFLNAVAATDTYTLYDPESFSRIFRDGSPGSYTYSVAPDWANRPVTMVNFGDAVRFANWMHNDQPTGMQDLSTTESGSYFVNGAMLREDLMAITRDPGATWVVPTEDEWYKAAYHKNDGPTGNYWNYATSHDNTPSNDLIDPDPGNNANFKVGDDDYTLGSPYFRTEVGEFENSVSPYGTFDQNGNVTEWTETLYGSLGRAARGGNYINESSVLHANYRVLSIPEEGHNVKGFRLARVPEPSAIVLLAAGGLAVLGRRRP